MAILDILFRWVHIISAVLAVGGAFFMLVLLPRGLQLISDGARREEVLLRCRRGFKMTVHPAILGLLVSGAYNTVGNWQVYSLNRPRMHGLWGPHLLLGLIVIGISLWLLAGKSLRTNHRRWLGVNLSLMFLTILIGSTLKWARDREIWSRVPEEARKAGYVKPAAAGSGGNPAATQPATPLPATIPATLPTAAVSP